MRRPLLVTDPALAKLPMIANAVARARRGRPGERRVLGHAGQSGRSERHARRRRVSAAARTMASSRSAAAARSTSARPIALMVGPDAPDLGFRGSRRLVHASERGGHGARRRRADDRGHGLGSRRASVITDSRDHTKKIIFHPRMMPGLVIEDPELTVGLPPQVTAATGMDALSHCLEAYCAPFYHPLAEGIAVEGMRLIKEWLPVAVRDGTQHRSALAHAHRLVDGRDGVSERARRHAQPESSVRRESQHASRAHECRGDAVRARVESRGDRREDGAARRVPRA